MEYKGLATIKNPYSCERGHGYVFLGRSIESYNVHRKLMHGGKGVLKYENK